MRRALAPLTALLTLAIADLAFAQAGGGSGGFGGGGGGGGGGGFGGSSSSGSGGGSASTAQVVLIGGGIIVFLVASAVYAAIKARKFRQRRESVRAASAVAAQDDDYLGADRVEKEGAELFLEAQKAWHARDRARLAELVGEDLMVEWNRRLDDFDRKGWHNVVHVNNAPDLDYMALVNREDDAQDRVVVRISASLTSYVQTADGKKILRDGAKTDQVALNEYWTLARRGDRWICVSIEQPGEALHHLDSPIIATPQADTERIRGQAVTELATADAVPEGFTTADLATVDFEGTAREEALDLSLADGRFAPDVLEVAARRAVAAWAEAVDGEDAELAKVATPEALQQLLYGGDASAKTRRVVRGPRVRRIAIGDVDASTEPARMRLDIEVAATRYVEDRDTTDVVSGSKRGATTFTERWTMALDGPQDAPWRVQGVVSAPSSG